MRNILSLISYRLIIGVFVLPIFVGNLSFGASERIPAESSGFFIKIKTDHFSINLEKPLVCDNVTDGGLIEGDEIECPDPIFDPALITNVTLPSGGTGDLEYLWIFTTDDPLSPLAVWTPIPNSNTPEYDPGPITVTTYYMRCARRNECVDYSGESNFVTKEIKCCDNVTDGGMIGVDQSICGDSINPDLIENLVAPTGGAGNLEYQWFENTTGVPFDPNSLDWRLISGATSEDFDPDFLYETTYFIRCSKRDSCVDFEAKSNIVTISLFENPQIDSTGFENLTCFESGDGSINIYVSGGTMPYNFNWTNGLPNTANPTGLAAGDYAVFVTDQNDCEAGDTLRFSLDEPEEIVIEANWWKQNCNLTTGGAAAVEILSGGVAPFTFLWSDSGATMTDSLLGVPSGTYFVTVTDATGCEAIDTVEIILPDLLTVSFATSYPTCFGFADGQSSVIPAGGTGQFSYEWNDPLNTKDSTLTNVMANIYTVTITDTDGCEVIDSTELLEPDSILLLVTSENGGCDTPLGSATANATGGTGNIFYEWSGMQMTPTISDLPDGQVFVLATDDNGCSASGRAIITNVPVLEISTAKEDFNCMLGVNGSAWVTATGGQSPYSILWSDSGMTQTDTVRNLMSGNYSVTVTDALGCERIETVDVENISPISLTISKTDNTCLGDEIGRVVVTVSGGEMPYTYLWDNTSLGSGNEITNLPNGTFNVTVTDANGCQEFGQATVLQTSDLSGTVRKNDLRCNGLPEGVAEVMPTGGVGTLDILWSNNQTMPLIQNLSAGNFSVTVTDEENCEFIDTVTLTQPDAIVCSSAVVQPISGFNADDGILEVTASGGVAPLTYRWSTGDTTPRVENLGEGNYVSAVIDQNGCECISSVRLVNPSRLAGYAWNDENENGLQNTAESGMENIKVTLTGTDDDGNPVNLTALTNNVGNYEFDDIRGGDYNLNFGLPTDFMFSPQDVGTNDNIDSDANALSGNVTNIFLNQGSQRHYDVGMFMENSNQDTIIDVGDYVWIDTDRDGNQDGIEAGIPNFRVHLVDAGTNQTLEIETTNLNGEYLFTDVAPGEYYILFDPISLPSDYVFTIQDNTSDARDSDANASGRTANFTITAGQNDNLTIDAGVHGMCDDVSSGGNIGSDEQLCGSGADPAEITNITSPSGGAGNLEYLWLYSFTPVYNGPGDPNWLMIPNSDSESYDPGPIAATTYYIRCTRRAGCPNFSAESNIVKKEIINLPDAQILNPPTGGCRGVAMNFEAKTIGGGSTYSWTFSGGANPSTANGRMVNGVVWNSTGVKTAEVTVSRFNCSNKASVNFNVVNCSPRPGGSNFSVYPNPVSNLLKVKALIEVDFDTKVQLINIVGDVKLEFNIKQGSTSTVVDLNDLAVGVYFLKIGAGTQKEEMKKIFIQK